MAEQALAGAEGGGQALADPGRWRTLSALALVWVLRAAAFGLLFGPILLVIVMSFSRDSYSRLPPSGFSLRWYVNVFARDEFVSGALTSLAVASVATPVALVVGTLAAYGLWKHPGRLARAIETLLIAPIMLPLVVTGLALLVFFNTVYPRGGFPVIAAAHVIITLPYVVRAVLASLLRYDRNLDEAAAMLGVSPVRTFLHVTLPVIRPGLFSGALFSFVMSFDDFATTIFLVSPDLRTLPIAIYQYMEFNLDATVSAVSSLLVLVATLGVLLIERLVGMDRFVGLRN